MSPDSPKDISLEELILEISSVFGDKLAMQWEDSDEAARLCKAWKYKSGDERLGGKLASEEVWRIIATGLADSGCRELDVPGVRPRIMKMIEAGQIKVRHMRSGLLCHDVSEITNANTWSVAEDADKVREELLTERHRQNIKYKAEEGRYTLEEAAEKILLSGMFDDEQDDTDLDWAGSESGILTKLSGSAIKGELPTFQPGTKNPHKYGGNINPKVRIYYEETYWSDLNKWLQTHLPTITFRFPDPQPEKNAQKNFRGVTKQVMLSVDWPLPKGAPPVKKILEQKSGGWALRARIGGGKAGLGAEGSHLWNPAEFAHACVDQVPRRTWRADEIRMRNFLKKHFPEFFVEDDWPKEKYGS